MERRVGTQAPEAIERRSERRVIGDRAANGGRVTGKRVAVGQVTLREAKAA